MTENKRKSVLAKIKALLAKTVENGCTEAEAMAALEVAQRLMNQHEIDENDLTFGGEEVKTEKRKEDDRNNIRSELAVGVSIFCDCRVWSEGHGSVVFCGLESDVVFAHWLLDTLSAFVSRSLTTYLAQSAKPGVPSVRRTEINGFVIACTKRINQRLRELAHANRGVGQGRGIVVAKNALIDAHMRELGLRLQNPRRRHQSVDSNAADAGRAAGDRATFNRPVNGGAGIRSIGYR